MTVNFELSKEVTGDLRGLGILQRTGSNGNALVPGKVGQWRPVCTMPLSSWSGCRYLYGKVLNKTDHHGMSLCLRKKEGCDQWKTGVEESEKYVLKLLLLGLSRSK
jgi:hypothetical protein